ncbi:hypothetical protein ACFWIP_14020, partial [Streptomyces anulatus]
PRPWQPDRSRCPPRPPPPGAGGRAPPPAPLFSQPGALPEAALEDVIGQARKLDMDEVRKSVEEQKRAAEAGQGQGQPEAP